MPARGYNRPQRPQRPREAFGNRPRAAAYQGAEEAQDDGHMEDHEEAEYEDGPDEEAEPEEGFHGNEELSHYYPRDEEPSYHSEAYFATPSQPIKFTCRRCQTKFASKNLLHKYLRAQECHTKPSAKTSEPGERPRVEEIPNVPVAASGHKYEAFANHASTKVIKSTAGRNPVVAGTPRHLLRLYHYLRAVVKLSHDAIAELVCWDTGCSVTLIDRAFLKEQLPKHTILRKDSPLVVRGIGSSHHSTTEYVNLDIYVPGKHNGRYVDALIQRPAFVVDNLRAKMLIGMDILASEDIDLTISTRTGRIGSCGTTFELNVEPTRPFVK